MTTHDLITFAKRKPTLATLIAVALLSADALSGRGVLLHAGEFAYASDVSEQGEKIDRILSLQIAATLRDLQKEECRGNGSRRVIADAIEEYQQQYLETTGRRYSMPACGHED